MGFQTVTQCGGEVVALNMAHTLGLQCTRERLKPITMDNWANDFGQANIVTDSAHPV